ncbi:MAG: tetratricopeptide repeat protein [Phycisphaerae bacterium]
MTQSRVGMAHRMWVFSLWLFCVVAFAGFCTGTAAAEEGALPAPKLVQQGNKLLAEKRYVEALQKYEAAGASAPDAPEVAYNRGLALYRLDRFDDAESAFQDAIKPDRPKLEAGAKYNLARCAQAAAMAGLDKEEAAINDLSRAIGFYEDALKLNPDDAAAASNESKAKRMITYLQKRLEQKKKQQQKKKDQKKPSSQPTSRPTSQPTSQPSSQPTSQPNQPQSGDKQDSQQDKSSQPQQDKSQKGEQKDADQKSGKPDEDRKMSKEEAERFLQQARDAERHRREQKRRRAMRLRGRIPVKKDW